MIVIRVMVPPLRERDLKWAFRHFATEYYYLEVDGSCTLCARLDCRQVHKGVVMKRKSN